MSARIRNEPSCCGVGKVFARQKADTSTAHEDGGPRGAGRAPTGTHKRVTAGKHDRQGDWGGGEGGACGVASCRAQGHWRRGTLRALAASTTTTSPSPPTRTLARPWRMMWLYTSVCANKNPAQNTSHHTHHCNNKRLGGWSPHRRPHHSKWPNVQRFPFPKGGLGAPSCALPWYSRACELGRDIVPYCSKWDVASGRPL
jgi:hypothetical protein